MNGNLHHICIDYTKTAISFVPDLSMTYFRTYTEFLSSSLADNNISHILAKWEAELQFSLSIQLVCLKYHDFTGPGVDVTKLLKVFQEIL